MKRECLASYGSGAFYGFFLLSLGWVAGCAVTYIKPVKTYAGLVRPLQDLAIVVTSNSNVVITDIDDKGSSLPEQFQMLGAPAIWREYHISPGAHKVDLSYVYCNLRSFPVQRRVHLRKNHVYRLWAYHEGDGTSWYWRFGFRDLGTTQEFALTYDWHLTSASKHWVKLKERILREAGATGEQVEKLEAVRRWQRQEVRKANAEYDEEASKGEHVARRHRRYETARAKIQDVLTPEQLRQMAGIEVSAVYGRGGGDR